MSDRRRPRSSRAAQTASPDPRAALALSLSRALGASLDALPETAAGAQAALAPVLEGVRASGGRVSLGDVVRSLRAAGGRQRVVRRALAEVDAILAQQAYARTKRAERGRLLAELLVALELEGLVGVEPTGDVEATLRLVRRAAELVLRGGHGKAATTTTGDAGRSGATAERGAGKDG